MPLDRSSRPTGGLGIVHRVLLILALYAGVSILAAACAASGEEEVMSGRYPCYNWSYAGQPGVGSVGTQGQVITIEPGGGYHEELTGSSGSYAFEDTPDEPFGETDSTVVGRIVWTEGGLAGNEAPYMIDSEGNPTIEVIPNSYCNRVE